jgi:protease YdgD
MLWTSASAEMTFAKPPPGIMGTDDRVVIDSCEAPWQAVGRINVLNGRFCTGTLISADEVLTAAHCLWDHKGWRWAPADWLHFMAGYNRGNSVASFKVKSYRKAEKYSDVIGAGPEHVSNDWAVLKLVRPAAAWIKPIPIGGLMETDMAAFPEQTVTVLQAGYSKDTGQSLSLNARCEVIGLNPSGRMLAHDCDAVEGDSGSPILLCEGDGLTIIGVHVGTAKWEGSIYGVAVPSQEFLKIR